MSDARLVSDAKAENGEGPLWSRRDQAVYWVDIKGSLLHRYGLDGDEQRWAMPDYICWVRERHDKPGLVIGLRKSIAELTLSPFRIVERAAVEPHEADNRLNDARADAKGRIWFGSMDNGERRASGALYRLDPDFTYHEIDRGYVCANGPTFSPDGRRLYHTDSAARAIYQFDVGDDGSLTNKRLFASFTKAEGTPDGMTTDSEGCLWVCLWQGWGIIRLKPDGSKDRIISLPVSQVTSCTFAGDKLDRLFVTSARIGLSEAQLQKEPHAGGLFELDPGVSGLPTHQFAG
jgi:sugar lactone lactonase YvrE